MKKLLVISLALMSCAAAEVEKTNEVSRIRVIALGEDPIEGLGFMPPPLTYLPGKVFFQNSDGDVAGVSLNLGEFSGGVEVPGGVLKLPMRLENRKEMKPWLDVTLPRTGDYLVILSKSKGNQNGAWKRVRSRVVDLGDRDVPEGSVRFVNASGGRAVIRMGDQKALIVDSGSAVVRENSPGGGALKIGSEAPNGGWKMAFANVIPQVSEGEHLSYFLFDDETLPLKIKILKEAIVAPEKVGL